MNAPLDEARLRELERLERTINMLRSIKNGSVRLYKDEADTLLDALSAERERGDKAVGLLRRWLPQGGRYDAAIDTRAFLATQKAEGA